MDLRAIEVTDGVDAVRAGFTPEFVALDNGKLVGCTALRWWDEADGTRMYLLLGWVEPVFRGRGHGREILAWQENQAREHLAAHPAAGPAMYGGNPRDDDPGIEALLRAAGYEIAFTRIQLMLELDGAPLVDLPAGIELRAASADHHRDVFAANAEVFNDRSLGYVQDTFEEFEREAADDFPDHELWTLAYAGDQLAGWVISAEEEEGVADTPWVGVRPAFRRRGLASAVLRINHAQLLDHGIHTSGIWTLEENPNGSVALYESLGYRRSARQPRYRKPIQGQNKT
jgi:GNAT superfamily N-acetyltransferase